MSSNVLHEKGQQKTIIRGFKSPRHVADRNVVSGGRWHAIGCAGHAGRSRGRAVACERPGQPNVLVIMGDHVGIWNVSAHHRGLMGGRTPNGRGAGN